MTCHIMKEKNENIDIELIKIDELEELEKNISDKINILKKKLNTLELNKINFKIIDDDTYNDNIILYKLQNKKFEKEHFLFFIKYCYKYLCNFISNVIEKMMEIYKKEFNVYLDFGKSIIIDILSKFE